MGKWADVVYSEVRSERFFYATFEIISLSTNDHRRVFDSLHRLNPRITKLSSGFLIILAPGTLSTCADQLEVQRNVFLRTVDHDHFAVISQSVLLFKAVRHCRICQLKSSDRSCDCGTSKALQKYLLLVASRAPVSVPLRLSIPPTNQLMDASQGKRTKH